MGIAVVSGIGLNFLLIPLQLRAGLSQDFMTAFDVHFIKQFVKLMWKEVLLGVLFLMLVAMVCAFGGMLLCFVGVYVTMGIVVLAQTHWMYQLYEILLTRGGPAAPLKVTNRLTRPM